MLVFFDVTFDNRGSYTDSHLGYLVLHLVDSAALFKLNLLLSTLKYTLCLVVGLVKNVLLAKLSAAYRFFEDFLALLVCLFKLFLVFGTHSLSLGLCALSVVIHVVYLLLP